MTILSIHIYSIWYCDTYCVTFYFRLRFIIKKTFLFNIDLYSAEYCHWVGMDRMSKQISANSVNYL